jgi:hypothetical protein
VVSVFCFTARPQVAAQNPCQQPFFITDLHLQTLDELQPIALRVASVNDTDSLAI